MLFHTSEFIFIFLPAAVALHFILARHSASAAIIATTVTSLAFYTWWRPPFVLLPVLSILANFWIARRIAGANDLAARRLLIAGIVANLALLGWFKYADFVLSIFQGRKPAPAEVPLALSFTTFVQIAFLADVWRRRTRVEFAPYAMFVAFFPHLIAGPIVRWSDLGPQIADRLRYRVDWNNIALGLTIFTLGLAKKVLIADRLAPHVAPVFEAATNGEPLTAFAAWGAALAYSAQLYFDFSGYSDMAVGLGLLFNLRLPINFAAPFRATSIIDLWRRWHISLSRFLRDFVYVPLGGAARGPARRTFNLFATMTLGGLWHGANWTFIAWGAFHGVLLAINHAWRHRARKARTGRDRPLCRMAHDLHRLRDRHGALPRRRHRRGRHDAQGDGGPRPRALRGRDQGRMGSLGHPRRLHLRAFRAHLARRALVGDRHAVDFRRARRCAAGSGHHGAYRLPRGRAAFALAPPRRDAGLAALRRMARSAGAAVRRRIREPAAVHRIPLLSVLVSMMSPHAFALCFVVILAALLAGTMTANVAIDPEAVFGTHGDAPRVNANSRYTRFVAYRDGNARPDGVLFASSRGTGFDPAALARALGVNGIANFSVNYGMVTDHLPVLEYLIREKAARGERLRSVLLMVDVDHFGKAPWTNSNLDGFLPPAVSGEHPARFWWRYLTAFQFRVWRTTVGGEAGRRAEAPRLVHAAIIPPLALPELRTVRVAAAPPAGATTSCCGRSSKRTLRCLPGWRRSAASTA